MTPDAVRLAALFQVDAKNRDDRWHDRLNTEFWPTSLGSFRPHVMFNDVLHNYSFRLGRDAADGGAESTEPAAIVDYAIREGIGMLYWPSDEPQPLWSFSLGDILSYRLYGTPFVPRFWNEVDEPGEGPEVLHAPELARVGEPNEQMFPPLVRYAVRRFLKEKMALREPRVSLVQRAGHGSRLVFHLPIDHFGGEEEALLAFRKVAWCIPSCIPLYHIPTIGSLHPGVPV